MGDKFMCLFSVYNNLKEKKWLYYTAEKRLRIFEKIERKQSKTLGLKPLKIAIYPSANWSCFGMFEMKNKVPTLFINKRLLIENKLRFHALETIIHEIRHAYQYALVSSSQLKWWQFKLKKWKKNYASYITSKDDNAFYNLQPIERDAQKYTIKKMFRFKRKFKKESDYSLTIESIVNRYESSCQAAKKTHGFWYKLKLRKKLRKNKNKKA